MLAHFFFRSHLRNVLNKSDNMHSKVFIISLLVAVASATITCSGDNAPSGPKTCVYDSQKNAYAKFCSSDYNGSLSFVCLQTKDGQGNNFDCWCYPRV
ncbi:hypothetical protein JMJ77_0010269 [Colletotrichum scovillei]|uniref:Uncharacterized protein n=1 Tax=Colletotrichum scovillei TaxID=1209932 RepID=A0A9P7QVC7_9PEZI|nr:hypothetical protein JMJ78_0011647 [Colletotrichum scovillei]KAG7042166.1 hypothetical protein JMJ77_0010269 [Colletotrichum scovillei]KAG7062199.1 hypothetical protein JMJ76_0006477 [Colletotrichum scovillei]